MSRPDEASSITTQLVNASAAHITPEMIKAYSGFLSTVGRFFHELRDRITVLEKELETLRRQLEAGQADEPRARKPREKARRVVH